MKRKLKRRIKEPCSLSCHHQSTIAPSFFTNLSLKLKIELTMEKRIKRDPKLAPKIISEIPLLSASRVLFIEKTRNRVLVEQVHLTATPTSTMKLREGGFCHVSMAKVGSQATCFFSWLLLIHSCGDISSKCSSSSGFWKYYPFLDNLGIGIKLSLNPSLNLNFLHLSLSWNSSNLIWIDYLLYLWIRIGIISSILLFLFISNLDRIIG